jgi:hypothetical protein
MNMKKKIVCDIKFDYIKSEYFGHMFTVIIKFKAPNKIFKEKLTVTLTDKQYYSKKDFFKDVKEIMNNKERLSKLVKEELEDYFWIKARNDEEKYIELELYKLVEKKNKEKIKLEVEVETNPLKIVKGDKYES